MQSFLFKILVFFTLYSLAINATAQKVLLDATFVSNSNHKKYSFIALNDKDVTTYWQSEFSNSPKWILIQFPKVVKLHKIEIHLPQTDILNVNQIDIQTFLNGNWHTTKVNKQSKENLIELSFEKALISDRIRLFMSQKGSIKISEINLDASLYVDAKATVPPAILLNQSGFNLHQPKRFTVPNIVDNTSFYIQNKRTQQTVYQGMIKNNIGDFSDFNPSSSDEYVVKVDTHQSYPFRIAPYWLERVTYRNMVDFMIGARHYVGTTNKIRNLSWAWRDGDFFNWSMRTLVAQYLSNPTAYERMEKTIIYQKNETFPKEYAGKWGALEPYHPDAPDIIKLIHWDADVKISQGLEHEHQKAELAHFLYVFPYLKKWLPQQNFDVIYQYLKEKWEKPIVETYSTTQYDKSPEHNLLTLKTQLGTHKGELAPGHTIIPNLMMHEVVKRRKEKDAEKYFKTAFQQMEWLIKNLDWNDPMTTKGQRMSEHFTMRAFAFFYTQYNDQAPDGLYKKVEDWAKIMIDRSQNMWNFRKFEKEGDWIPYGWNETGNVLGFPCAALAATTVLKDETLNQKLRQLAWAHFDNAFGRNPTGRHFSYDAAKEIEGVELGWYSYHHGGVGLLEEVPFVFDGSPKSFHYPNNYEVGNLGWTEGWVPFNTAFNVSMAYLAYTNTSINLQQVDGNYLEIRLKAPLNFYENQKDQVEIILKENNSKIYKIRLQEEGAFSPYLSAKVKLKKNFLQRLFSRKGINVSKGTTLSASYGLGYFEKKASLVIE